MSFSVRTVLSRGVFPVVLIALASSSAWSQTQNGRGDGPQSKIEGERIWNLMSDAPYTTKGSTGSILYVLAYSTCPYAADFYRDWDNKLKDVQVRWIFYPVDQVTVNSTAEAALRREPKLVAELITGEHTSPPANHSQLSIEAFNRVKQVLRELEITFAGFHQSHLISPTFIWKYGETVYVSRGYEKTSFASVALPPIRQAESR